MPFNMDSTFLSTPVALFLFKRPEQTRRVFEVIRQARPERLFVIADGPRTEDERAMCNQTRAIIDGVDWPCELVTNYADSNLGLRVRLSTGISWVFEQVEDAIILEDDCLPHPTFFRFCRELLERYREEPQVMHIGGLFYVQRRSSDESYYFTKYPHVSGWATWRRAWQYYDRNLETWADPAVRQRFLQTFDQPAERRFWRSTIDKTRRGEINTWDYQWTYSVISHGGLCINPTVNLVKNLGLVEGATHVISADHPITNLDQQEMKFPLRAPSTFEVDREADQQVARINFQASPAWKSFARSMAVSVLGERMVRKIRQSQI